MERFLRLIALGLIISTMGVSGFRRGAVFPEANESVLARLSEARSLLANERVGMQKGIVGTRRVKVSRRRYQEVPVIGITGREIALAVLDSQGNFHVVRGLKRQACLNIVVVRQ